jgi:hypothetical protein
MMLRRFKLSRAIPLYRPGAFRHGPVVPLIVPQ